jgi:hypothetical protein
MEHTAQHNELALTARSSAVDLAAWQQLLVACAGLGWGARTRPASSAKAALVHRGALPLVEAVLHGLLTPAPPVDAATGEVLAGEAARVHVPAVATVVATLEPLLAALPTRAVALTWHDRWLPRLRGVGRCPEPAANLTLCPACRRGAGCALDLWPRYLAAAGRAADPGGAQGLPAPERGEDRPRRADDLAQEGPPAADRGRRLACPSRAPMRRTARRRPELRAAGVPRRHSRTAAGGGVREPAGRGRRGAAAAPCGRRLRGRHVVPRRQHLRGLGGARCRARPAARPPRPAAGPKHRRAR